MRDSLHDLGVSLGVKQVKLAIDYDSEEKRLKRTVTITAEVSLEEAARIDYLTKLNATFLVDLHVESGDDEDNPSEKVGTATKIGAGPPWKE